MPGMLMEWSDQDARAINEEGRKEIEAGWPIFTQEERARPTNTFQKLPNQR